MLENALTTPTTKFPPRSCYWLSTMLAGGSGGQFNALFAFMSFSGGVKIAFRFCYATFTAHAC